MPSLIASGVSPFHQIGAGNDTSTVSCPALAGLAIGIEPFWPVSSQLPIMSAAFAGVEKWADSAVVLRCRFRVAPLEQWNVRREFLRRLKRAFDERGIEIPYPHLTVYAGVAKDGTPSEFRVRSGE